MHSPGRSCRSSTAPEPSAPLYLILLVGMDIATAHTLYEGLKGRDLTFLYSDVFADDHTAAIMGVGQEALDVGTERTLRSRLSFVLVEAYQNIIRHRADNGGRSVLMLQRAG